MGLESDNEGRCLVLESLSSLARFGLWPVCSSNSLNSKFVNDTSAVWIRNDLPLILADEHAGVRSASARLWACLNCDYVNFLLLVGRRLEAESSGLPALLWR